ncbi:hypothetical protein KDL44_03145 [bacterium]|nr:hypothetical protein [bacterium]
MGYYAQKPPKKRDPYGGDSHARPGIDPDGIAGGWGCELAACLSWAACGWPCSFTMLLAVLALMLAGCAMGR